MKCLGLQCPSHWMIRFYGIWKITISTLLHEWKFVGDKKKESYLPLTSIHKRVLQLIFQRCQSPIPFRFNQAYYSKSIQRLFQGQRHTFNRFKTQHKLLWQTATLIRWLYCVPYNNIEHIIQFSFGSVKKLLMDGMISGDLLRTSFLRPCSEYFSPSEKLSKTPAALFCFVTLF